MSCVRMSSRISPSGKSLVGSSTARVAAPRPTVTSRRASVKVNALQGGPPEPSKPKKQFISREEEPEQYWQSKAEADGNVFKDPLAIVGVVAILFPFLLLALFGGTGVVDFSVYRGQ